MVEAQWRSKFGENMATEDPVVANTVEYVRTMLQSNDASHDWNHIERVWRLSVRIAKEEGVERLDCVVLAALLHDIDDWKYTGSETTERAKSFLNSQDIEPEKIEFILKIIKGIGFKEEIGGDKIEIFPELACVQDADRLDAIGAIGIARCLTFGGHKKRPLYDPSIPPLESIDKNAYMANKNGPTVNHFYEKLFKLKDMMKTATGRRIAQERHAYMEQFIERLYSEIAGQS